MNILFNETVYVNMTSLRIQPLRLKQSQIGGAYRSEQITAWLNYNAQLLFNKNKLVYMTSNFNKLKPYLSETNASSDIFFHEKTYEKEPFEDVCSSSEYQMRNEVLIHTLTNKFYYVTISKSLISLIKYFKYLPFKERYKDICLFIKLGENGHNFAALYFPFKGKTIELFDAGGSSLDIVSMKEVQYNVFKYLFGENYERNPSKLIIISKQGYQDSLFDEYCQTWIYLYLYMRCYNKYTILDWNQFMSKYSIVNHNFKENTNLGFTGTEMHNKNRLKLELITRFRKWFLNIYINSDNCNKFIHL